jgi:hypothetical protein
MSLEQQLAENTAAIEALTDALFARLGANPAESSAGEPTLTYDQVKEAVLAVNRKKGGDATRALLAQFKVTNAKELQPAQYADMVQAATAALAA